MLVLQVLYGGGGGAANAVCGGGWAASTVEGGQSTITVLGGRDEPLPVQCCWCSTWPL